MSRRVRRTVIACRASLAGAAAVVLLAACGGGDSGADSSATGSAAEPTQRRRPRHPARRTSAPRPPGSTSGSTMRWPISRATTRRLRRRSARSRMNCAPSRHPTDRHRLERTDQRPRPAVRVVRRLRRHRSRVARGHGAGGGRPLRGERQRGDLPPRRVRHRTVGLAHREAETVGAIDKSTQSAKRTRPFRLHCAGARATPMSVTSLTAVNRCRSVTRHHARPRCRSFP